MKIASLSKICVALAMTAAMAAVMASATQILERDAIFMMRLLFLYPGAAPWT